MSVSSTSINVKATITTTKDGKFTIENMELDNIVSPSLPKIIYLKYVNAGAIASINDYLIGIADGATSVAFPIADFPANGSTIDPIDATGENKAIFARIQSTNIYINKGLGHKTMLTYNNANNRWDMYGFDSANPAPYYTYLGNINNTGELPNLITLTNALGKKADNTNLTFTIQAFP
jgi:hypothetical protein